MKGTERHRGGTGVCGTALGQAAQAHLSSVTTPSLCREQLVCEAWCDTCSPLPSCHLRPDTDSLARNGIFVQTCIAVSSPRESQVFLSLTQLCNTSIFDDSAGV